MQQSFEFFIFEFVAMLYIMMVIALVAEEFMMPSLKKIAVRYRLSKDLTGFIVALGNLIPEFTTTFLSFLRHGVKMTEFAMATNIGASMFAITIVPAVAAGFTPPLAKGMIKQEINKSCFFRDLGFFTLALVFYSYAFIDGVCSFQQCCFLVGLVPVYLVVMSLMSRQEDTKKEKSLRFKEPN